MSADPLVERVGRPFIIEAVRMLEAGEGSVAGIDAALGEAGYALGPLRLLDEIGLDVDLAIDRALGEAEPRSRRFEPPALQLRLVQAGRLGRRSGHGFYRYEHEPPVSDVEVDATRLLSAEAVVERLQLGMVNEAYRAVEDGLAAPPRIDEAMRAAGYPRGPFEIVDELGLRVIVERLRALAGPTAGRSGEQYQISGLLWQMASA